MNQFSSAFNAAPKARKNDLVALFLEAQTCHDTGRLDDAQVLYRQVLRKRPDHFDTLHRLGVCEYQRGNPETALQFIRRALMVDRKSAEALSNLATVLLSVSRYDEALACCDKALALQPNFADAHYNRGTALNGLKRYAESIDALDASLSLNPHHADSFNNMGSALHELGRFKEAITAYDGVLALNPEHGLAVINRGGSLKGLRQLDEALAHFDRGLELAPHHAKAWFDRGDVLVALGRLDDAMASYRKALDTDVDLADAWVGCANVLMLWRKLPEALAACERALMLDPHSARAFNQLGQLHAMQGSADMAVGALDCALAIKPDDEAALSSKIFFLDYSQTADVEQQQQARSEWWRQIGAKLFDQFKAPHANDRQTDRKIVLGYVSGDFNTRSPAYSFRPVLESHDRSRVEVVCYSASPTEDAVTESFRRLADRWRDASQWSDDQLADGIRADKVDILIDLSGHTDGNRLRTFARKPAPVQVTAWGFGTGTGLRSIDYMFSDPVALPAEDRHHYAEQIYDLPSLMIMEPPPAELRCSEPPVLANGHLTYGVFNRVSKFSDAAIAVWARILQADVSARLLIKDQTLDDDSTQRMLLARFGSHGIGPDRISMLGTTSRDEHLMAYRHVDICLDPFPQNGGISTWEALHMGVPVVAKLGTTVPSRCAGAILAASGLTDWVANDDSRYVDIAAAATPERLKSLRGALPEMIAARCSPEAYTRAVEEAYRTMWATYCAAPASGAPDNCR
jgi:predicted O-linked N-acetylglucosamine transferase (SPINDLY family)